MNDLSKRERAAGEAVLAMTYAELLAELQHLTPEQLAMPVRWCGDERGGVIQSVWVLKEDYVNFGYGGEPWSAYADDPDCKKEDADRIWPAGTVFLDEMEE